MELKNIAILGPRGNVGNAIITELLKDGSRFAITAISRPGSTYTPPDSSNIVARTVDYDSLSSLTDVFAGQDAVINCITGSATQWDPSKRIIDAAIAAGVKFFFANEFVGYVTREQYKRLPESVVGAKFRIRAYLEEVRKEEKIRWASLNGGPFFDMWLMKGPAGFDIPNRAARIYGTGDNKLCWTPLSSIGLAAANMIRNPGPITNRPIYICTVPAITQNIILSAVESILGTKFTIEHIDVAKMNKNARIALERGEVAKAMKGLTISNQFYEGDSGNDFSALVENETVGLKSMSVEDAVKEAMNRWGVDTPVVQGMYKVDPCEV